MILRPLLLAALLGLSSSAGAAPAGLAPYHEPPWLVTRGASPTLAYALLPPSATGTAYVRSGLRGGFTRIALRRGTYCPGDPADAAAMRRDKVCGSALLARVPRSLTLGSRLFYYAVIKDHGRSVTVRSPGLWIVRRFVEIRLGAHRFDRFTTPEAVVARTGPHGVGITCCADPPGGDGPSSFDVAADGSVWVLDRINHRLLVWKGAAPSAPPRSVPLPTRLEVNDFTLGDDGTIYVRGDKVYALSPAGKVHWQVPAPPGVATAQLRIGPDGALYAVQACGISCAPFGGHLTWTALTTSAGKPLAMSQRRPTPFEPLPGGLRLVAQISYSAARFALINRANQIVRAWRVTSATRLSALAEAPELVNGDPVVPFEVSSGPRWGKLVVRLGGSTRVSLADRPIVGEVNLFAPLRITPDGRLYQLRTSVTEGMTVARYSVNR